MNTPKFLAKISHSSESYTAAQLGQISGQAGAFAAIINKLQYNQRLQLCRITALTTGTWAMCLIWGTTSTSVSLIMLM